MQHAECNAVPVPFVAQHADRIRGQPAVRLRHRASNPEGPPQHIHATGVILVVVTDNEKIDAADATRPQVGKQRHARRRAAALPACAGIEDEHMARGLDHDGESLAHVDRRE